MPAFNNDSVGSFFQKGSYENAFGPKLGTSGNAPAVQSFFGWLQAAQPQVYAALVRARPDLLSGSTAVASRGVVSRTGYPMGLRGLGDVTVDGTSDTSVTPTTSWGSDIVSTINQVLPAYFGAQYAQNSIDIQKQNQQALLAINIQRAEQGLPPLTTLIPTPGQTSIGGMSPMMLLMVGGLAYLALKHK